MLEQQRLVDRQLAPKPHVQELEATYLETYQLLLDGHAASVNQLYEKEKPAELVNENEVMNRVSVDATGIMQAAWFLQPEDRTPKIEAYAGLKSRVVAGAKQNYDATRRILSQTNAAQRRRQLGDFAGPAIYADDTKHLQQHVLHLAQAKSCLDLYRQGVNPTSKDMKSTARFAGRPYLPGNRFTQTRRLRDHMNNLFDYISSRDPSPEHTTNFLACIGHSAYQARALAQLGLASNMLAATTDHLHAPEQTGVISPKLRQAMLSAAQDGKFMLRTFMQTYRLDDEKTGKHLEVVSGIVKSFRASTHFRELNAKHQAMYEEYIDKDCVDVTGVMTEYVRRPKLFIKAQEDAQPDTPAGSQLPDSSPTASDKAAAETAHAEALQQLEALLAAHSQTEEALALLRTPYNPSSRALRQAGLMPLVHTLVTGYHSETTGEKLAGISKAEAIGILGLLQGLQEHLPENQDAQDEFVAGLLQDESQFVRQLSGLRQSLKTLGKNGFSPLRSELANRYAWLYMSRGAMFEVIDEKLPASEAETYRGLLHQLFGAPTAPEEATDATPEPVEIPLETPDIPLEVPEVSLEIPLAEQDAAQQLDWIMFPPEATLKDVIRASDELYTGSDMRAIEWQRIADLLELVKGFDGTLYRAKPRSLGSIEPYFAAEITVSDKTFTIAENPQYGNATYILRADLAYDGLGWQEIFVHSRQVARDVGGAHRVYHTASTPHLQRIMDNIQGQLLVKAANS